MKKNIPKWRKHFMGSTATLLFLFASISAFSQTILTGKITTVEDGEPLPGATVLVKGTATGTVTDGNGQYSLEVTTENPVLVISFVGYTSQEVSVNGRSTVDIEMPLDITALQELVVVGYGTQTKESVTGSVATVSPQEITALPVPSVESAIQGRVSGVNVTNVGSPGSTPVVRVRGVGSISFGSGPLYVVDGFPVSSLNNFDNNDIESISVLKDASSTAIYGSRAAQGLIIITTKTGKRQEGLRVNVNSSVGVQSAWKKLDLLNREQYLEYAGELLGNAGLDLPDRFASLDDPTHDGATQTYNQTDVDMQDEMFRNAAVTNHHVSVGGSGQRSNFYSSVGYFKQEGIMLGTEYERINFRINSTHDISDRFQFGQNLMISNDTQNPEPPEAGARSQVMHMLRWVPYMPLEDPTAIGGYRSPNTNTDGSDPENPVRTALQDVITNRALRLFSSAFLKVNIADGLSYKFTAGVDFSNQNNSQRLPIYDDSNKNRVNSQLTEQSNRLFSSIFTNQISYNKSFGNHSIGITAVGEKQTWDNRFLESSGEHPDNDLQVINGASNLAVTQLLQERALISYLGRVNYEYGKKYLFTASVRRDASSLWAPGSKSEIFPAVGLGWRLSEESFMSNVEAINELKIRASYGKLGFAGVNDYIYQSVVEIGSTPIIGNVPALGAFSDLLGNPFLSWEITTMTNVGVDLALFNDEIIFSAEYYKRTADNLIINTPLAPSVGQAQNTFQNVAEVENKGVDLELGYNKSFGELKLNVSGNVGIVRNKVVSLASENSTIFAGQDSDFGGSDITLTEGGQSIQGFYGWRVDGIFQSQEEVDEYNALGDASTPYQNETTSAGDIRFKDLNGDGVIDANDREYLGNYLPDFSYGLNVSAEYKGLDMTLFIQGVQGNEIYNGTKVLNEGMVRLFGAGVGVLDAWTPENTDTDIPRAISGDPNGNARTSDRFIEDGSYLRIKNLSIGYTFPSTLLESAFKNSIQKIRVYVAGTNLLTLTGYTGYDPEVATRRGNLLTNGVDYGQFPSARTLQAGIQVGF